MKCIFFNFIISKSNLKQFYYNNYFIINCNDKQRNINQQMIENKGGFGGKLYFRSFDELFYNIKRKTLGLINRQCSGSYYLIFNLILYFYLVYYVQL